MSSSSSSSSSSVAADQKSIIGKPPKCIDRKLFKQWSFQMRMYIVTTGYGSVLDPLPVASGSSSSAVAAHAAALAKRKRESMEVCNMIVQSLGPDIVLDVMNNIDPLDPALSVWNELERQTL